MTGMCGSKHWRGMGNVVMVELQELSVRFRAGKAGGVQSNAEPL